MKNTPNLDLTAQLTKIFGEYVVNEIKKVNGKNVDNPICGFEELHECLYNFLYLNSNLNYINFYENHKQQTRFILITLEKYYGYSCIDFSNPLKKTAYNFTWEIEHIFPKSCKENLETENVHNIGNLTLIKSKLNSCKPYSDSNFKIKKELLKKRIEKKLFLNKCFMKNEFSESDIKKRRKFLIRKFNNIFFYNKTDYSKENFSIKYFTKKLNIKY